MNRIRPEQVIPLTRQLKDVQSAILAQIRGLTALQKHRDEIEAELARRKAEQGDK